MSDDHTTADTGPAGETTTDTPTGATTTEAPGAGATDDAATGATTEPSGRKSWRGRSRAEKPDKPAKAEKAEKTPRSEKPARAKKEKEPVAENKRKGAPVGVNQVRSLVGRLIWVVCLVFALALAITALLIALKANADNDAVRFIVSFADRVDLGVFDLTNPIKDFDREVGPARDTKTALFNYGIGAIVWLLIGRIGDKVVRP